MKKLLSLLIVFYIFLLNGYTQSIPYLPYPFFKSYNFECGGFITAVFPARNTTNDINKQILYAKSDIGGVYKSWNNGQNWILISNYRSVSDNRGTAYSEYITAGLAVHPIDSNRVVVGWGAFREDAALTYPEFRCLSVTSDGGASWRQCVLTSDGILFNGDYFPTKVGGECIIFDPREGHSNNVFAGGIHPSGGAPILYASINGGESFSAQDWSVFPADVGDTVYCIYMHKSRPEIWIGTAKGIFRSPGINSQGILQPFVLQAEPGWEGIRNVRRILLKSNGMAFFAFGNNTDPANFPGGGIARYNPSATPNYQWDDLTTNFEYSGGTINSNQSNFFSLLAWADDAESILLGGRVDKPTRKSTNYGLNWVGEDNHPDNIIQFKYATNSNYPNHQPESEQTAGYMFGGLNFITRNQNTGCTNTWYLSGGAGLRISDNTSPSSGVFEGKTWHYSTQGQSMPVIFDIVFEGTPPNDHVYFPMADWTMGWKYPSNWTSGPLQYDDRKAPGTGYTTWISNVSRHLISDNTATSYIVGGDLYSGNYLARIGKRVISGSNVTIDPVSFTPLLGKPKRNICDGVIFNWWDIPQSCPDSSYTNYSSPVNTDCMLFLVGGIGDEYHPYPVDGYGLFYTTNGGTTFGVSSFTLESQMEDGLSTEQHYQNSYIPGMRGWAQGWIQEMWGSQFNLAKASGDKVYLYLKNGGMFMSSNKGIDWVSKTSPIPNDPNHAGCLKWVGNNRSGFLVLAVDSKGLYKGTIDGNGDITWTSIGGFTDASQVDYKTDRGWAVFGKRSGDTYRKLYKSIYSDNNWKLISNKIRGVRSLRFNPNKSEELFIATTGLGVIIYINMTNGEPSIAIDNVVINQNSYFEEDIVVDSSGSLTIEGNINVNFAPGKKIHVNEGGKLNIQGVTFNSLDSSQQWGGIEVENCDSSLMIQNCTFNNASLPIKITNNETSALNEKIIKNNVFNCQNSSDFAIYAENVFNILIQGNQFNMSGESSSTVGLEVKNTGNYSYDDCNPKINIINNTFTNGCASMVLNSYASELTPVYIYGNTFNGSSANYNIIGRMITGTIKNNRFLGTDTDNPIYLQQCTPDMFGNIIIGSGTTMILNGHSYPNLSPLRTNNTYYWSGGQNNLFSSVAGNINIINAGLPLINYGHNQFSKNPDPLYFHIAGVLDSTVESYSAAENAWCSSGYNPVNYLYTSGNPYVITDFSNNYLCEQLPAIQYTGSVITNIGFGMNDTIFTSSYTNSYIPPDEILYSQANVYISEQLYFYAINSYKNLINTHIESQYLNISLYEIFDCYQLLDTSSNTTYRNNLYSDLMTFLNDKIQSGNYSSEFIDVAYYLVNMCEVNMENYNDALTGFEFIAMFHPDAEMRLLASWDYDEVQDLMGQSGAQKEVTAEQFRKKVLSEIENAMKNDSTMRVVSRMFKQQNEEIDNTYANKTTTSKFNNENNSKIKTDNASKKDNTSKENSKRPNIMQLSREVRENLMQRAEDNLRALRTMNTGKKIKKHKEDILLIAGLTAETEKKIEATSLPLSYSLSQNYPNPFNPVTKINYELPGDGKVKLMIYDVLGREIKTLVNEVKQAGKYTVEFNGSNFASGVYFYRIESGKFTEVKRMVLVK